MTDDARPEETTVALGRPTVSALVLALALSAGVGVALGIVYGTGNYGIGLLEVHSNKGHGAKNLLNILLFAASLFGLSRVTAISARLSRFRSLGFARVLGAWGGAACLYAAWAAHASWTDHELRVLPTEVWRHLEAHLNRFGGAFFALVSAVESGALLFLTSGRARRELLDTPFCGTCNRWLTLRKGIFLVGAANLHRLLPHLRQGRLDVLAQAQLADPNDCARMDFAACEGCAGDGYLSMVRVKTQVGPDGALHHWETVLFQNVRVRRESLSRATGQS